MSSIPAIPNLFIVPGQTHIDYEALYAIATAYAHSGLLLSDHGKQTGHVEFTFPAIVCTSLAIELFMKFFLMLDKADQEDPVRKHDTGHSLTKLWDKIKPEYKSVIAGMFGHSGGTPFLNATERRIELFAERLKGIGDEPFIHWRYIYESDATSVMSHAAVAEVLNALRNAAEYIMRQRFTACAETND